MDSSIVDVTHVTAFVDSLGKKGRLKEALEYIYEKSDMDGKVNIVTWKR